MKGLNPNSLQYHTTENNYRFMLKKCFFLLIYQKFACLTFSDFKNKFAINRWQLMCIIQTLVTAKPTERQKKLTILGDSLAKQSESRLCKFLWKSVQVSSFLT